MSRAPGTDTAETLTAAALASSLAPGDDAPFVRIPAWFAELIEDSLVRLHSIGFEGRPAGDALPAAADSWAAVLWDLRQWDPADTPDLIAAVHDLCAHARRWPSPRELMDTFHRGREERRPRNPPPLRLPSQATLDTVRLRQRLRADAARGGKLGKLFEQILDGDFQAVSETAGHLAREAHEITPPGQTGNKESHDETA